ncbi:MAG: glycosyltransferase family 2 protein [Pseudomonadota bacterium]
MSDRPAASATDGPASTPRIVAVATMKDEAPYILEWIAWHRLTGISDFVIFSNDCSDGTDAMLDRLAEMGIVEHCPNPVEPGKDPQQIALRRAFAMDKVQNADWVIHFDTDEFLDLAASTPDGIGTLADFIAACEGGTRADAIAIPWRYMGSHGLSAFTPKPVTARFRRGSRMAPRETHSANGFKTIFRPGGFDWIGIHKPKCTDTTRPLRWLNASGEDITKVFGGEHSADGRGRFTRGTLGFAHGTLRHYAVKSRAEFLFKRIRGTAASPFQPNRLAFNYWLSRNINSVPMPALGGEVLTAEIVALEADPALSRLQEGGRKHLTDRIAQLATDPANARFLETGDTRDRATQGPGRLLCLGTHHKTGTIWMRRVLRQISDDQNIPMQQLLRIQAMQRLPKEGAGILVHWDADFPRPLYQLEDARIIHVIRDPRDVLLSGMRYHRVAPHAREKYLLETQPGWGGLNYQDYLNALPDDCARLIFEMDGKHRITVEEMLAWHCGAANTIELRYEDLIVDTDCSLFRSALEEAAIDGLDIDKAIAAYWKHSLFGGIADPNARDDRVALHVRSGAPAQWRTALPREVAEPYAAQFGDALKILGYASTDDWVAECPPAAEIEGFEAPGSAASTPDGPASNSAPSTGLLGRVLG